MSRFAVSILLIVALISASVGQRRSTTAAKSTGDPNKLIGLKASGTTRYSDKEILAASGLQLGQAVADADFKEAARSLGNSGLFSEVVYTYTSSDSGVKLELQLTDADHSKLVPVHFENFVWFTDTELLAALQPRVPLFKQLLPITGNLPDHVSEALQAILIDKHFPGRVDYLREGQDQYGGPLIAIAFKVEEVSIVIHDFEFQGATPEQSALLRTAARRAIGGNYIRSGLAAIARLDLLPVYLQSGYLKASFAQSDARVLPQSSSPPDAQAPPELEVDAIIPVTPGKIYSASGVDWKGNAAIAASEVAPLLHLPTGQPADAMRFERDIEGIAKLYRSRGYMAVKIKPDAQFDEDKSTVHYELNISEGDLYSMGELEILGLDTQAKARMQAAWTLRTGQPYNADYPKKFLDDTRQFLPRGAEWNTSIHETPDPKDKTVDVEIRFKQQ